MAFVVTKVSRNTQHLKEALTKGEFLDTETQSCWAQRLGVRVWDFIFVNLPRQRVCLLHESGRTAKFHFRILLQRRLVGVQFTKQSILLELVHCPKISTLPVVLLWITWTTRSTMDPSPERKASFWKLSRTQQIGLVEIR